MADIAYECPTCNTTRMISEFADPQKISCRDCGGTLIKAGTKPPAQTKDSVDRPPSTPPMHEPKANKLKLARDKNIPLPEDEPLGKIKTKVILEPEEVRAPLDLHPKVTAKKRSVSQPLLAILLFLVIGCAAFMLRYGEFFTPEQMEPYLPYAWVGVMLLHLSITLKALTDDMMQGIMCIFIPGWSFIYLILSDNFYQKAVIFGLLVGIGLDGGTQLLGYAAATYGRVQEFINTGGGDVRRR